MLSHSKIATSKLVRSDNAYPTILFYNIQISLIVPLFIRHSILVFHYKRLDQNLRPAPKELLLILGQSIYVIKVEIFEISFWLLIILQHMF